MPFVKGVYDNFFLTYKKILMRLRILKFTTKNGKEISELDLRKAIDTMIKKHPSCRWRSEKVRSKRYFVLIEGYDWLQYVYFQKEKSLLDADVDFFKEKIKQYEELLKIDHSENWWKEEMNVKELERYFCRKENCIRKAIKKMCQDGFEEYKRYINGKVVITKEGVEWLCKNVFKQKYLKLLEKKKMELTEEYIKAGHIYDYFFDRN